MKPFLRWEQMLEENIIDIASVHSKQSNTLFFLKGVCAANLKKVQNCQTFVALFKNDA